MRPALSISALNFIFVLIFGMCVGVPSSASANSCALDHSRIIGLSDVVFFGSSTNSEVVELSPGDKRRITRFQVLKPYKGVTTESVDIYSQTFNDTGNATARHTRSVGEYYYVFANENPKIQKLEFLYCGPSTQVSDEGRLDVGTVKILSDILEMVARVKAIEEIIAIFEGVSSEELGELYFKKAAIYESYHDFKWAITAYKEYLLKYYNLQKRISANQLPPQEERDWKYCKEYASSIDNDSEFYRADFFKDRPPWMINPVAARNALFKLGRAYVYSGAHKKALLPLCMARLYCTEPGYQYTCAETSKWIDGAKAGLSASAIEKGTKK